MLEAVEPIRVRLGGQSHELQPGQRIDLPEDKGRLLLERAPGKLRIIETGSERITIESAATTARPVFFENSLGEILGPATVTDLAKVGAGENEQFWIIVEFDGQARWVRSDRLRSRRQFETQAPIRSVEHVKEPK